MPFITLGDYSEQISWEHNRDTKPGALFIRPSKTTGQSLVLKLGSGKLCYFPETDQNKLEQMKIRYSKYQKVEAYRNNAFPITADLKDAKKIFDETRDLILNNHLITDNYEIPSFIIIDDPNSDSISISMPPGKEAIVLGKKAELLQDLAILHEKCNEQVKIHKSIYMPFITEGRINEQPSWMGNKGIKPGAIFITPSDKHYSLVLRLGSGKFCYFNEDTSTLEQLKARYANYQKSTEYRKCAFPVATDLISARKIFDATNKLIADHRKNPEAAADFEVPPYILIDNPASDQLAICISPGDKTINLGDKEILIADPVDLINKIEIQLKSSVAKNKRVVEEPFQLDEDAEFIKPSIESYHRTKEMRNFLVEQFSDYNKGKLTIGVTEYTPLTASLDDVSLQPVASCGSSKSREICILDPNKSPELERLFKQLEKEFNPVSSKNLEEELLRHVMDFISTKVFDVSGDVVQKLDDFCKAAPPDAILKLKKGGNVSVYSIDSLIKNKVGVCRHHALVSAYFLDKLVKKGRLKGKVQHMRDNVRDSQGKIRGGHVWATFMSSESGKKWHFDSLWKKLADFNNPTEARELERSYGEAVIVQQIIRTSGRYKEALALKAE